MCSSEVRVAFFMHKYLFTNVDSYVYFEVRVALREADKVKARRMLVSEGTRCHSDVY
jgi:hypothetical protein